MKLVTKGEGLKKASSLEVGDLFVDTDGDVMMIASMDGQKVIVSFEGQKKVFIYRDIDNYLIVRVLEPKDVEII